MALQSNDDVNQNKTKQSFSNFTVIAKMDFNYI